MEKIKIYDKTLELGTVSRSVTSGFFFHLAVEFWSFQAEPRMLQ